MGRCGEGWGVEGMKEIERRKEKKGREEKRER